MRVPPTRLLSGGAIVLAISALVLASRRGGVPTPSGKPPAETNAAARQQLTDSLLAAEIQALKEKVAGLQATPPSAAPAVTAAATAPGTVPLPRQHGAAVVSRQLDVLATRLDREPVDTAWVAQAGEAFASAFRDEELAGVHLARVRCASTLCGMELAFDDGIDRQLATRVAMAHMPWKGEAFFHLPGGGDRRSLVYLARPNHQLPVAEAAATGEPSR